MSSSQDSFSERQTVLFPFKEISLKEGITADNTYSHKVDSSPEMPVASFRDSACAFEFTGLKDSRVDACKSNEGLMRGEVSNIAYFSKESGSCSSTDTVDGSNDFHLLNSNGLAEIREYAGDIIELLHQMEERRDFLRQNKFLSEAIGSDRVFSGSENIVSVDGDLSAFTAALKRLSNNLSLSGSDKTGRREFLEEQKHCCSKDITDGLQFRESALKNPLNLVLSRSDKMTDGFSFSGNIPEVSGVLRDGKLLDGIIMDEDELGDSKGIFPVGFGLTQRQFCEIRDKKGINDNSIDLFRRQERKKIDMVASGRFHACHDSGEVFTAGSDSLHQFHEPTPIHSSGQGKTDIAFSINTCSGEGILGNINADKQFTQSSTSIKSYSDKAGEASRPILHDDKDSMIQSTYYGYGRQGTDSLKGSLTQDKTSSPACPFLTGKTRLYKFYNINS